MKKILPLFVVFLLAVIVLQAITSSDFSMHWDGDEIGGPFGALLGLLCAGGGLIVAAVVLLCLALCVGVVLAGVGVMLVGGMALCGLLVAALLSPILLPVLIPLAIIWWLLARSRKQRHSQHAL